MSECEAQNSFYLHAVVWGNYTTALLSGHQSHTWTNTETRPTRLTSHRALEEHISFMAFHFSLFPGMMPSILSLCVYMCHTRAVLSVARLLLLTVSIAGGLRVVKRRAAAESSPHPHIIYVIETRFTAL